MAKPTIDTVLAATTRAALLQIYEANDLDCVDLVDCVRCKACTACEHCTDCKNCQGCSDCINLTNGVNCTRCTNVKDATNCSNCHGSDANQAAKLYGCENCTFVERAFFVKNEQGTEAKPIRNRFMQLQLTPEQFDQLWALP